MHVILADFFSDFFKPEHGWSILSRWWHVLAGITWIGLLYFFNFVQTPAFAEMSPGARSEAMDKITWRALWWFRWAAALTFLTGLSLLGVERYFGGGAEGTPFDKFPNAFNTGEGLAILTGALLATTMFLNVWLVIWPNQQIVIGSARQVLGGGEADPRAADAGKKGARASRANTFFSIPMVFFMVFAPHFADNIFAGADEIVGSAGQRLVYWIILLATWGFVELNALGKIGGYDSPFNAQVFNDHRRTIIGGLAYWVVLFLIGWEIVLR